MAASAQERNLAQGTREKLLDIALEQFAERGFDGVSIADIADVLGLSKQALLHHFSSKEKLYGELLARISGDFEVRLRDLDPGLEDVNSVAAMFLALAADSLQHRRQTALLMRELLDNRQRADRAGRWYLKPFLDLLIERVQSLPRWRGAPRASAAAAVYQVLGAINYFAISGDTLRGMWGDTAYGDVEAAFPAQLQQLVIATLERGPG